MENKESFQLRDEIFHFNVNNRCKQKADDILLNFQSFYRDNENLFSSPSCAILLAFYSHQVEIWWLKEEKRLHDNRWLAKIFFINLIKHLEKSLVEENILITFNAEVKRSVITREIYEQFMGVY